MSSQEDGVGTAIETIYRELEYAKSLIKHQTSEERHDAAVAHDNTTFSPSDMLPTGPVTPERLGDLSGYTSSGRAPSEDWSVISDYEEAHSSTQSRRNSTKSSSDRSSKRNTLAAAVLSVLPNPLNQDSSFLKRSPSMKSNASKKP